MAAAGAGKKAGGSEGGKKADRDLDLANCGRGMWLVKVPKYISDRWEKAAPDTEVGKLRIKKVPGAKPEVNLTLADSICASVTGLSDLEKNALVSAVDWIWVHCIGAQCIVSPTGQELLHTTGDPEGAQV
jgi:hypothetical protein